MKILFVFLFLIPLFGEIATQDSYEINGYYISNEGDTVYGYLVNNRGKSMIYRDSVGNKKRFTPSRIKGFCINEVDYKSASLPDVHVSRFLLVLENGAVMLLSQYGEMTDEDQSQVVVGVVPGTGVIGVGVGIPVSRSQGPNSGFYIQKKLDSNLYPVPSKKKFLYKFIEKHFPDNEPLVKEFIEKSKTIEDLSDFVFEYNNQKEAE